MTPIEYMQLARSMLDQYGLQSWTVIPLNTLSVHGYCAPLRRQIGLSIPYCKQAPHSKIVDTILHEIAHALSPVLGHGKEWKEICLQIGANPIACSDFYTSRYLAICKCGQELHLRRLGKNKVYYCNKCMQEIGRKQWKKII